jgi:hypothetical protein
MLAWLLVWFTPKLCVRYIFASGAVMMLGSFLYDHVKFIYWVGLNSIAAPILAVIMMFCLIAIGAQARED